MGSYGMRPTTPDLHCFRMTLRALKGELTVLVLLAALVFAYARVADALNWHTATRLIVAALGLACFVLVVAPLLALMAERRRLRRLAAPHPGQLVIREIRRDAPPARLSSHGITAGRVGNGTGRVSTRR
jgi:hypothetical protein